MANERLIDANKLLEKILSFTITVTGLRAGKNVLLELLLKYQGGILQAIREAPTVDAVPVVHGRWIPREDNGSPMHECSECGARIPKGLYEYENPNRFCYHCGARMERGEES